MLVLIKLAAIILLAVTSKLLFDDLFPSPSRHLTKVMQSYTTTKGKRTIQSITAPLAKKLERFIIIGKYKRIKLESILHSAHIDLTPEAYLSQALAPALLYGAVTIPLTAAIFFPLSFVFIFIAVLQYQVGSNKAQKAVEAMRADIAVELPHFANTIAEELKKSRNIPAMLSSYCRVCGDKFRRELDITLADMSTGNHYEALGRLSSRVGSLGLAQICRGLQSVLDGNDQQVYFQLVSQTLESEQEQQIEREIQSMHDKIVPYSMAVFGCMFLLLIIAIGIFMLKNSK